MEPIVISISPYIVEQFVIIGIISNVISMTILAIVVMMKLYSMPRVDQEAFWAFFKTRATLAAHASPIKIVLNALLVFLPFYNVYIHIIMYLSMIVEPGILGMFRAFRRADEFSIFQLVFYTDLNNK